MQRGGSYPGVHESCVDSRDNSVSRRLDNLDFIGLFFTNFGSLSRDVTQEDLPLNMTNVVGGCSECSKLATIIPKALPVELNVAEESDLFVSAFSRMSPAVNRPAIRPGLITACQWLQLIPPMTQANQRSLIVSINQKGLHHVNMQIIL